MSDSYSRPLQRLVWSPEQASPPGHADSRALADRRILVLGHRKDLASRVAAALGASGARAAAAVDPSGAGAPPSWDGIVDLNLTGTRYRLGDTRWRSTLTESVDALRRVYPEWAADTRYHHRFYLAVTDLGGLMGFGAQIPPQPLSGIWAGLAKGLCSELPALAVKALDLDSADPEAVAAAVAAECAAWDLPEVGRRCGRRYTLAAREQQVPPPALSLGPADTVLVTGGGRGVGFALARGLAEAGCRVVVTGRSPWPRPGGEASLGMDDAEFSDWRRRRLTGARSPAEFSRLRAEMARVEQDREMQRNLNDAARSGLRVEYEPCDCTSLEQMSTLVAKIRPTIAVHNAVSGHWLRLDRRSPADMVRAVEVKVDGFAALVGALTVTADRRAPLRLLCNVGSLAGRIGGMVGQVAYSGANDGLASLGRWAVQELDLPVQTVSWPTWENTGNVPNIEAAARYGSMVHPADGVARWLDEIRAAERQEVVHVGEFGAALAPNQLPALLQMRGYRDFARIACLDHYLGRVESYDQFGSMRTVHEFRPGAHPCLSEFLVDGTGALPVSVLLEYAMAAGDWVVPRGRPRLYLRELREVRIRPDRLVLGGLPTRMTRHADGGFSDGAWQVRVRFSDCTGAEVGQLTLVYGREPARIDPAPHPARQEEVAHPPG